MKTRDLIDCLRQEERKEIVERLQSHRRQAMLSLFVTLTRAADEQRDPGNDELFPLVFGTPYRKADDYLLRNELRLLNREIESFLLEREVIQRMRREPPPEIHPTLVWLEILLERRQFRLFEKEWRRAEKTALEGKAFLLLSRLYIMHFEYVYQYRELHSGLYRDALTQLGQAQQHALAAAAEQFLMVEVKNAYIHRILHAFDQGHRIPYPSEKIDWQEPEDAGLLFDYLRLWARTYVADDKIPLYRQLLEWQPAVSALRPELARNEYVFLNNLALLWMHRQEYAHAATYFEQAMDSYQRFYKSPNLELVFNQLSNLTRLMQNEEVVERYQRYREMIEADSKLRYKFGYLLAMNHLFQGQTDQALTFLPEEVRKRPHNEYLYARFIYAIAYYLDGMDEAFEREIQNLYQTTRYKAPEEGAEWKYALSMFRKFLGVHLGEPGAQKHAMAILLAELDSDLQLKKPNTDNLIMLWLRKELERMTGKGPAK